VGSKTTHAWRSERLGGSLGAVVLAFVCVAGCGSRALDPSGGPRGGTPGTTGAGGRGGATVGSDGGASVGGTGGATLPLTGDSAR
jgi:hypothetical protein